MEKKCLSCNTNIANVKGSVEFDCPECGEYKIIRCRKCRMIVSKYVCPNCKFEGPN